MWCPSWLAMVVAFVKMAAISCHSRTISVNLDAKWSHTPLLLEASEFLAQESNDQFWKFVNDIADLPEFQKASSEGHHDEALYHLATKLAGRLLSPLQLNLLEFSLALRSNSPAVEMYNQIAHDLRPPGECDAFVEVNNIVTCERMALTAFIEAAKAQAKPILVKQDHYYPGSEGRDVTVILYAQVGKPSFYEWHTMLRKLADDGVISYVLRHYVKEGASKKVRLSGYGVELAIKSTEYKAKDDTKVEGGADLDEDEEEDIQGFYFNRLKKLHPDLVEELTDYRQHLVDSVEGMAPLKVWQLQDLSFQAAQRVVSSEPDKALETLRDISQNFPTMARTLVRSSISDKLRKEVFANQQRLTSELNLSPGDNVMFINGLQADLEVFDVFNLLETLRSEAKLMEGLYGLAKQYSVSQDKLTALLRLDLRDRDSNYAVDTRDPSVVYINDLEKDKKYSGWPGSVQDLLRPTFPGMLRHIRRNLFHLIFCVNPADSNSRELLKMAEAFYVHNAPARIGFVFVVDEADEAGVAMVNAFHYISETQSGSKALSFITDVYQRHAKDITADKVQLLFKAAKPNVNVEEVFGEDSPYTSLRQESTAFFAQTGLASAPQVLLNGVPLSAEEISSDEFEEAVVTAILHQTPELQKAVYNGYLNDKTDALDYLMMRPNVMPRINARILAPTTDFLDFSKDMPSTAVRNHDAFSTMSPPDMTAALLSSLKYLTKKDEESLRSVSIWVICDLDTPEGRDFLYSSIKHMKSTNNMRIAVIHNSALTDGAGPISKAVQVAIATLSPTMAKNFVTKMVKEENVQSILDGGLRELAVGGMDFDAYEQSLNAEDGSFVLTHRTACDKLLNLLPGQRAIIVNGKVLGPLGDDEQFQQADFALLEKYSHQTSAGKIMDKVTKMDIDGSMGSELVMKADALLSSVPQKESRKDVQFAGEEHSVLKIPPHEDGPAYEVVAIFDPATRAAQKYTPLIMVLQEVANVNIKVFLNCRDKLSEMPLNSFYRYVLEPRMKFAVDSSVASGPMAHFRDMPLKPILTLGMDPPESWLVEAVRTAYDLDNIHLEEVEGRVDADFELEYLLLEGHCHDSSTGQPPRGLQYTLGTQNKPAVVDTIVMANLGYFQLKATPGMWFLRMRGGRSEEIFEVISHDNTDSPEGSSEVIVVMDSFKSKIIRVKVSKKAGMEEEDLLAEGTQPEMGLWDSISSKLTGTKAVESTEETINIFSLASGHLYERFLRIMMTSVLKHTKSKVKFWFLKNYLSPSFKDFIPHMAKEYNFEYELVQYKWPRWLHQQREKQRIIWGYKILFLDVLFPLSINKIIFVDADQIVRTDLKELCDFDLEGAPYGYTPFCESRKEMDGFRFWKSGYWASHLAGRKYHISALYVVDLKKFRKIAAGDRLRGQYQGLSQDPNSLSNLDQDLPNNMIHQVGIKSLPQEWLWCETWCSTSELKNAKTIDLCNNPQTKEPKLTAAQRIVPEWTEYDQQIKSLWDRVYKTNNSDKSTSEPQPDSDSNRDEL